MAPRITNPSKINEKFDDITKSLGLKGGIILFDYVAITSSKPGKLFTPSRITNAQHLSFLKPIPQGQGQQLPYPSPLGIAGQASPWRYLSDGGAYRRSGPGLNNLHLQFI
jgi:hypothetical protein